jgi:hypothetical protein
MAGAHVDLVSHWRIAAPAQRVWAALAEPETWPAWWPSVRAVRTLRRADGDGVGGVRRIEWRTRLAAILVIELEALEAVPLERLRSRVRGGLAGEDIWLLRRDGPRTELTYVWRVAIARRALRPFTPLLAPLLRWNHAGIMRAGERGLGEHLLGNSQASD